MRLEHILETCLYVDDLAAAEHFYTTVLGVTFVSRVVDRHVFFRCGDRMLLLFRAAESSHLHGDIPPHGAIGAGHLAFAVRQEDIAAWRARLHSHAVAIEKEITWPGGGLSIYFRDPAGNSLEIATPMIWGISEQTLTPPITPDRER